MGISRTLDPEQHRIHSSHPSIWEDAQEHEHPLLSRMKTKQVA